MSYTQSHFTWMGPFHVWAFAADSSCTDRKKIVWTANSSGYVYFRVQSLPSFGNQVDDVSIRVKRTPPSEPLFNVTSAVVVPDTVEPNKSVTVQARVHYSQPGVSNPLTGKVGIFVNGTLAHTLTITPDANETLGVSWIFMPTNVTGNVTVAVRAVPRAISLTGAGNGDTMSRQLTVKATDYDNDGITTQREQTIGTDPRNADTDGDRINDGTELQLNSNPMAVNSDSDRLHDDREYQLNTNLTATDTDSDNLDDGRELSLNTNPRASDTDNDGIVDGAEVQRGLDPTAADTDSDGVTDGEDTQPAATTATPSKKEGASTRSDPGTATGPDDQSPQPSQDLDTPHGQQSGSKQEDNSGPETERGPEMISLVERLPAWRTAATALTFIVIAAIVLAAMWFWDLNG